MSDVVYFGGKTDNIYMLIIIGIAIYLASIDHTALGIALIGVVLYLNYVGGL